MSDYATIIVQYNNWTDTVLCLESVLQSHFPPRIVIVVDNCSSNDAVAGIVRWASGEYIPALPEYPAILSRHVQKPYPLCVTTAEAAESCIDSMESGALPQLLLVKNSVNTGYSGGNNIGLRIGLAAGAEAFWILNNDTIVEPGACGMLYQRLFACERPGLAGGLVCYLTAPNIVQCRAGGYTNPCFFLSKMNGHALTVEEALQAFPQDVENNLNFIYGASVMVSRAFVKTVGLMDERLFLYCEEQDWSWSAAGRFDLAYTPEAKIFHKEGGSIGMSRFRRPLPHLFLLARNKLFVTYKHNPMMTPFVCLGIVFAFFRLLARRILRAENAG